ncbi:uncharacterized protein LOC135578629 [Columba livia]|uniref:uncharacterized protein LOC135578629 n=1 Tax=Columba livia TaxID=8932 RepID=UPI0031BB698C
MACYDVCRPCGPTPLANSCNEPCSLQCQDSRVVIQPPAVLVTLPGPILTSHPQSTAVGSSASAAVGNELGAQGVAVNSGSFGYGFGGLGCFGGRRGGYICWPLHTTHMACYDACRSWGPTPLANSCNEPCSLQCQDSRVVIQPPAVLVTLPGPILTSHPQSTAVGSSASAAVGNELGAQGVAVNSGSFGYGFGGLGCFGGRRGGYIC